MNNTTATPKSTRNLTAFFILTLVLSVPVYFIATVVPQDMVMLTGLLIALAPITATLILAYRESRADGAKRLLKRCFDRKSITRKIWYAPTFLLMPVLFFLALGVTNVTGEPLPDTLFPVVAAPVVFLMFFILSLFEEIGWMGYVFDPMEERWNALRASIILGTIWAAWHIPLYILSGQGPLRVVAQLLSLIAIRTLIVWLYNNTGKNLFAVILIHAIYNVCTMMFASFYISVGHLITCIFIIVAAAIVVFLWGAETLAQYRFGRVVQKEQKQ